MLSQTVLENHSTCDQKVRPGGRRIRQGFPAGSGSTSFQGSFSCLLAPFLAPKPCSGGQHETSILTHPTPYLKNHEQNTRKPKTLLFPSESLRHWVMIRNYKKHWITSLFVEYFLFLTNDKITCGSSSRRWISLHMNAQKHTDCIFVLLSCLV